MTPPKDIDLKSRYEWKQVEAPKAWRPKHAGEELVGFYGGKSTRVGRFGAYDVVLVIIPRRGVLMISGTRIVQLADSSGIERGWPVRVVFKGTIDVGDGKEERKMKNFDVFVAEGDPVMADELPKIIGEDAEAKS